MTFQQLMYVVEISKSGSINRAAHKLFLSQSGISTAIHELEEELGIRFFSRSNRGVEFTPEGKEFLGYAVALLDQKQKIENLYRQDRGKTAPIEFNISTQVYPFAEDGFRKVLKALDQNNYQITFLQKTINLVIEDIYSKRAEIGCIFLMEDSRRSVGQLLISHGLEFHELIETPSCIYVRKDHPLTKVDKITEDMLFQYPYVSYEHAAATAVEFSEEYRLSSQNRHTKRIIVNNRLASFETILWTDAFTTGSGLLVEDVTSPNIITIPIWRDRRIYLGWIHLANEPLSMPAQIFVKGIEETVAQAEKYTAKVRRANGIPEE